MTYNLDRWANYMRSKLAADKLDMDYWREAKLPVTVLRLGLLYGHGSNRSPTLGLVQLGMLRLTIGNEHNRMPLTYVGNAVDCMLLAAISPIAIGQAYNVVDEPQIPMRDFVRKNVEITRENSINVPIHVFLLSTVACLLERKSEISHSSTPPKLSRYVIASACRNICYDTQKAREQLNWQSKFSLEDGLLITNNHNYLGRGDEINR